MGDEALFKTYEQGQGALFPAHLADALEASDPAFFIDEVVEALDLAGCGRTPSAGVVLWFRGGFPVEVERNCASARLPVPQLLIERARWVAEHQVGHSRGLIRTRL
jgi:hypothetical protein